jgi:Fe2+ or Zn2+ uptake regulation protein
MKRHVTKNQALAIKCTCGGSPVWDRDWIEEDGHYIIYCDTCGKETKISVRLHDVTDHWAAMNKTEPKIVKMEINHVNAWYRKHSF